MGLHGYARSKLLVQVPHAARLSGNARAMILWVIGIVRHTSHLVSIM